MTTLSVWKAVLGSYYSDSSIPKDLNKNEDAIEDEMEPITDEERRDSLCESSDASVESQSTRAKPELDKDSTGVTSRAIDLLYPQRTVNVKDASTQVNMAPHTKSANTRTGSRSTASRTDAVPEHIQVKKSRSKSLCNDDSGTKKEPRQSRWYCPYRKCRSVAQSLSGIYEHVHAIHCPEFPSAIPRVDKMLIKTYSGEDVKFDKASLDSFNHGELPRIEYIHATENYYFCPYKGCINKYKNHRPRLFMHIRKTHDPSFPRLHGSGGLKFEFFTTQTGKKILFDEESCDIIDKDDSITVKKPSKKTFSSGKEPNSFTNNETCGTPSRLLPIAHCPYEGCVCLYTARTRLYLHIRKKHDPDFPSLAGKNPKWKFTTQSGQEIYFDADSRDMVGELETIIVVK